MLSLFCAKMNAIKNQTALLFLLSLRGKKGDGEVEWTLQFVLFISGGQAETSYAGTQSTGHSKKY